jgi:hypothetical protein
MPNIIGKHIALHLMLLGGALVARTAYGRAKGGNTVVAQQPAPPTLDPIVTAA